jgi:pyruvate dehydrogenase E2 component (dihydrolipoamide acetyltransferase)
MATKVILPKVDMDQETGTIAEWLKQEGETVRQGEPLLVIETNKVSIEVEAPASGILAGIQIPVGVEVPIATVIAYILEPGEELPAEAAASAAAQAAAPAAPQAPAAPPARVEATPVARNLAAAAGVDLAGVAGSGPGGKVTKTDVETLIAAQATRPPAGDGKVYAAPAARRVAREKQVDLATVAGSGPQGRIQTADVLAALDAGVAAAVAALSPAAPVGRADQVIPMTSMRRTIAERLTAAYQAIPHISFTSRVDMTAFETVRAQLKAHAEKTGGARVSATAVFVKIIAGLLARHPWLNAQMGDGAVILRGDINVGVAVALEAGLIVPVVRQADQKGIGQIAAEVEDLIARARAGKLTPSDVSEGTFTISNLGPFGIDQFTAIINPPQSAIIALGATSRDLVPGEGDLIAVKPIMRMTLSVDHRIVDGAVAAQFMADLKTVLENPALLLW